MDNLDEQILNELRDEDLDSIFSNGSLDLDEEIYAKRDWKKELKKTFRYIRRRIKYSMREKTQKNFTNILYLTLDCPPFTPKSSRQDSPLEYIAEMQKQYPDNDIRVLIPVIKLGEGCKPAKKITCEFEEELVLERTSLHFEFFLQNKKQQAVIYRYKKDTSNIQVYGIYCEVYAGVKDVSEMYNLQNLACFIKAARIAVKKFGKIGFQTDIVHVENIPYYLGGEFEIPFPQPVKVLQIVKDFAQIELIKPEIFWAAINLADESTMNKICKDNVIKKCMSRLFNLKYKERFTRMRDCLESIYRNYYKFRKYIEQGDVLDENILFKLLNERISEMFPQLSDGGKYYNQMACTIKRADYWAVFSKTYYNEIFENPKITGSIYPLLEKYKNKGSYISYGSNLTGYSREEGRQLYQTFDENTFRELRGKNKLALLKEFHSDRIKTNFVDPTLFKGEAPIIIGSLDSFYESPLLFANPNTEIFANGVDILFNTLVKLFELHKNIRVILCIKDGLENSFIRSWLKFLTENKSLRGRWVYINGEINLPKFLAGSDMILLPRRVNITSPEHLLAMYYGCVPIVSRSGILNDTVIDILDDITKGCGLKTKKSLLTEDDNPEIFLVPIIKALNIYQNNPASWNLLIKNCLTYEHRWNFKILEKYNRIYQELL